MAVRDSGSSDLFCRASLSHLSNRVASLETERKNMRQMMDDFRLELEAFGQNMRDTEVRALLITALTVLSTDPSPYRLEKTPTCENCIACFPLLFPSHQNQISRKGASHGLQNHLLGDRPLLGFFRFRS